MSRIFIKFIILLSFSSSVFAQENFRDPLDIPMFLSGNFGELRSNHFHTGIDIKTQAKVGFPIYAVEDGYISRVKVSAYGYGKALYMVHPNGYTSVYAHLQKFTKDINQYAERAQYREQSYNVELYPGHDVFTFKKGDVIGYSGNSGSSMGPHLHFELRKTANEHPVNPLKFGFNIKDDVKPSIYGIMVYPMDDNSAINGKSTPQNYSMGGTFGNYTLKKGQTINTQSKVAIAINTIDRLNGYPNKCGIYTIKVWKDTTLIFHQQMDELDFSTKRYINAHKDYQIYKRYRKSYHRCYKLPNNKLDIYPILVNNGMIELASNETAHIKIEVTDTYQNVSVLNFNMSGKIFDSVEKQATVGHQLMKYNQENVFNGKGISLTIPSLALYKDLKFEYSRKDTTDKTYAPIHTLHHAYEPLHRYATVKITPTKPISETLKEKALIISFTKNGSPIAEGGKWENDALVTKTRSFGNYSVMLDTVQPTIKALTAIKSRILGNGSKIVFVVKDNLSGIKDITATIGGKWVLSEYDPRKNKIYIVINKTHMPVGSQPFLLTVTDKVGNTNTLESKVLIK